jgi:hypothetical protein
MEASSVGPDGSGQSRRELLIKYVINSRLSLTPTSKRDICMANYDVDFSHSRTDTPKFLTSML